MSESNTSKAVRGMSSQTLVTLILGIVEIVSFSIMSRLLSQSDFGYYAAISAITIVFTSFSETGIGSAIIQRKEISSCYINNAFTLSFIFGTAIMLLMLATAKPLANMVADASLTIPLMIMSVTLLCNCMSSVNTSIMYRRMEFMSVGIINLTSLVITTIVAVVLAIYGLGYYAILTKAVLTSVITFVLSLIMAKTRFSFVLDKSTFRDIFGFSGWLMASVFFRNMAQQLDKLLMGNLLSVSSLGAYNRPKEFINTITSKLGSIFDSALFPVLSQIQDNKKSIARAYLRSLYYLNISSIVFALVFIFNSELIIRIFFGQEWLHILPVLNIISLSIVFNFDARLADCYLRSLGLTRQQFSFRILEIILKIAGLLLGFKGGIEGVAISVVITNFTTVIMKHVYLSKIVSISLLQGIKKLVSSWQVTLFILPIMIPSVLFLPHDITGNIVTAFIFLITVIVSFLFAPEIVGREYKSGVYSKVRSLVIDKIHKFIK